MTVSNPLGIGFGDLERHAGRDLPPSRWHEVTQDRVDLFADATDDHQWIHKDGERSRREMGGPIAHGFLTLALLPVMLEDLIGIDGVAHVLNYGLNRVRFTQPVKVGRRVRGQRRILAVEQRGQGRMVTCELTVEIEGEARPACVAESLLLYLPAAEPALAAPA